MAKAIRLSVIGAGSAQFSLGIVRDLCLTEGLAGSSVVLMDIDEDRLDMVYRLASRYAQELGKDIRFEKTLDRETALKGADFVVNTALAGGHQREEGERALQIKLGYYRGIHYSENMFHQFDLMLSVARDVERICPDAYLLQSSNPVYDGCTIMTRETRVKVIGLCHGPFGGIREMARVLGLNEAEITWEAPGVNHCVWLTTFRYRGENAFPLLESWIEKESERYWADNWQPDTFETQMSPASVFMYRHFGLMPLGDTSRGLWPEVWWLHRDLETKKRFWGPRGGFDSDEGWQNYLDRLSEGIARMRAAADDPKARVTDIFPPRRSSEQIVPIMDAVANDRQGYFVVNVPNRGALPGIADDVVVEVPALIDGRGVRPLTMPPLPQKVMLGAIMPRILGMERRIAGYKSGDPQYILMSLLHDHRTRSLEHAQEVMDALMAFPPNARQAEHFGFRARSEAAE
jgi:alpha-galactosidase